MYVFTIFMCMYFLYIFTCPISLTSQVYVTFVWMFYVFLIIYLLWGSMLLL
jgi:hypothetical protein